MKNFKIIRKALVLISLLCLSFTFGFSLQTTAKASTSEVTLAEGNHEKWIDRIDLSSAGYARDFYDWLVENTDNDGVDDALIDFSQNEHLIHRIEGTFTVDASGGNLEALVDEKMTEVADQNFLSVVDYASMVYACFNRDHNEVFWLKREIRTLSAIECTYTSEGQVTYTQEINFLIKNEDFDARQDAYADGTLDIKDEIDSVNNEINSILSGVEEEASRYEKVKHFNKWLTENNCYTTDTESAYSRDCRGALLGQTADTIYAPVCEGYARAFKVLCDRAKIPCVLTSGRGDGTEHMWNLVQMENGRWYGVDVTWNDPTSSGVTAKKSGYENEDYLIVSKVKIIDGKRFYLSHEELNQIFTDKIALNNGPKIAVEEYGEPVLENTWDVSNAGENSVSANLYQADGYTIENPIYKLIISGNGNIEECANSSDYKWYSQAENIIEIEVRSNVANMPSNAFVDCVNLQTIKIYGNVTLVDGFILNPTSVNLYAHANYNCYNQAIEYGFNVTSLCQTDDWSIAVPQGCEQDEIMHGYCSCGKLLEKTGTLAHGHDYLEWQIVTTPTDIQQGLITRTCSHDNSHVETFDLPALNAVDYEYTKVEKAKCEEKGKATYVYNKDGQEIVIECDIEPIGHDYGEPEYVWDFLKKKCTAKRVCNNDHSHVETEEGVVTTNREVDCQTSGDVTFTATFTNTAFENQTKVEYMTARPHEYSSEYKYDEISHWYECSGCLDKKDLEEHKLSDWTVEKDATLIGTGLEVRTCSCGYREEKEIPKVKFFEALFKGEISGDMAFILITGGSLLGVILLVIIIKAVVKKK